MGGNFDTITQIENQRLLEPFLVEEDEENSGCDFIDEEGICIRDGDAFYCEEKIHCPLKLGYYL